MGLGPSNGRPRSNPRSHPLLTPGGKDHLANIVYPLLAAPNNDTVAVIYGSGDRDLGGGHLVHLPELGAALAVMLLGNGDSVDPLLLEPCEHLPLGPHHLTNEGKS